MIESKPSVSAPVAEEAERRLSVENQKCMLSHIFGFFKKSFIYLFSEAYSGRPKCRLNIADLQF